MTQDHKQGARSDTEGSSLVRHGPGFVASGLIAFSVDALVLLALTRLGVDPFSARIVAIAIAMVAAWLSHRRLTFAVIEPPSFGEFARYAVVASGAAAVNYAIYAALLLVWRGLPPLVALVAATATSMCVSYVGMRFGVFKAR